MTKKNELTATRKTVLYTGIEALDNLLGGLPNGSVLVIQGHPGSGFDIFAQQILFNGANTDACRALYFTVDHSIEDLSNEMNSRNWNVDMLIEKNRWTYIDAFKMRSNIRKGISGSSALLDNLALYIKKINHVWSVVDTISHYFQHFKEEEIIGYAEDIVAQARKQGGLHFLLVVEDLLNPEIVINLAHHTDGLFNFKLDTAQADAVGMIRIEKLRTADYSNRLIPYRITNSGLAIETSVRIS